MDTNNGTELEPSDESSEPERGAESKQGNSDSSEEATVFYLSVGYLGLVAEIELDYKWAEDSSRFWLTAYRTKVTSNSKNQGSLTIEILSGGTSRWSASWDRMIGQTGNWNSLPAKSGWGNAENGQVTVKIVYTFDIGQLRPPASATRDFFQPWPPYMNPIKNFVASPVRVTGTRGIPGCTLLVHRNFDYVKATARIAADGTWSADLQLPAGTNRLSINADQSKGSAVSGPSNGFALYRAALTSPAAGEVVPAKDLVYRAIGAPGSAMYALGMQWSDQYSEQKLVDTSGNWQASSTHVFPSGDATVRVRFYDDPGATPYGYTQSVTFKVLGYPRITLPAAALPQNSNFDLSGDNGLAQSTIVAYYDLTDIAVGQSTVRQDGTWTIPVAVSAGTVSLAVEQFSGGNSSGRDTYRSFKIKPQRPTKLTVEVDAQGKVTLGGVGHIGATFYLHVVNNGTPFRSFPVTTSPWTVLFPDWLPGTSLIVGRQSVPDGAGQPIYSDWAPENTTVVVPVPPPTLSYRVSPEGVPTFSGTGRNWAGQPASRVEVRLNNTGSAIVPIVDVRADTTWSSTATARWAPGTYEVTAIQRFTALQSAWVEPVSVVIPAPPAVIEKVTPNGLFAKVAGQCWPGAELIITFSDNPASHPVVDTDKNGQWDFQRPTAFRPGRHTVTVTQTFGGQTSNEVSMPFEIVVSVLVIPPPPGGQTDHLPVLQGTGGIDGFTISVFDYVTHDLLGETLATGNAWSVPLKELDYLTHTVFAIQVLGDLQSVPSTSVAFNVVLFAPRIDFPKTRTSVPRTFTVEGYARPGKAFDRTMVELYLDGALRSVVYPHFGDGYFKEVLTLPLGACVLTGKQYFRDQESSFTVDVAIVVVPDKAQIETPGVTEAVGRSVFVCGFGYPGDTVVIALAGATGTPLGTDVVQEDGTWFCLIELSGTAGELSLVTEQRNGEYVSGWSPPRKCELLEAEPTFTRPSEGAWVEPVPGLAGSARPGALVDVSTWYNPDLKLAKGIVATAGTWVGESEHSLSEGPHWARAVQVVGGKRSMPADSKRFEIAPSDEPPRRHPTPE